MYVSPFAVLSIRNSIKQNSRCADCEGHKHTICRIKNDPYIIHSSCNL